MNDWLHDADEIMRESFGVIRAEADLSGVPEQLVDIVVRMIHACGMTDIVPDIRWGDDVAGATEFALIEGAPVFCDCEAVRASIARKHLPAHTEIVRRLESPTRIEGCDILFIGPATGTGIGPVLDAAASKPVLTITASEPEGRKGIINFVVKDDRLRFEIDDAEAARHALRISSKLLSLAVSVKERMQRNPPP